MHCSFVHHPDGNIVVSSPYGTYNQSLETFNEDVKELGLGSYDGLPSGIRQRFFSLDGHIIFSKDSQFSGETPWAFGELVLENAENLVKKDEERRTSVVETVLSFDEKKQNSLIELERICAQAREKVSGTQDIIKISSWSNYRIMAERFLSGQSSQSDLDSIDKEISLRGLGETREMFVAKISENVKKFSMATALISGIERKIKDKITASTKESELDACLNEMKVFCLRI